MGDKKGFYLIFLFVLLCFALWFFFCLFVLFCYCFYSLATGFEINKAFM